MVLIAPQQYWYPRKAYVLEVPKIAWASLVMAFKGRASVSKNRAQRPPLNTFRMEREAWRRRKEGKIAKGIPIDSEFF